jgi:hypothetical protein
LAHSCLNRTAVFDGELSPDSGRALPFLQLQTADGSSLILLASDSGGARDFRSLFLDNTSFLKNRSPSAEAF